MQSRFSHPATLFPENSSWSSFPDPGRPTSTHPTPLLSPWVQRWTLVVPPRLGPLDGTLRRLGKTLRVVRGPSHPDPDPTYSVLPCALPGRTWVVVPPSPPTHRTGGRGEGPHRRLESLVFTFGLVSDRLSLPVPFRLRTKSSSAQELEPSVTLGTHGPRVIKTILTRFHTEPTTLNLGVY